jgi:U-box domain/Sel1 repeat
MPASKPSQQDLTLPSSLLLENEDKEAENDSSKRQTKSPEDDLICPITLELPWDPVTAEDGRVYERAAIEEHFKQPRAGDLKSPISNEKMGNQLFSSPQIKSLIETLVENGGIGGDLASKWNEKVKQQKKMEDLLKKAEGGDSNAMQSVALCYKNGTDGFKKDQQLALKWCKKAHEAGNVMGTANLGYVLCKGLGGVATCHSTGIMYLGIAAARGSNFAAFILGMALAKGEYGTTVNVKEAIYWLEEAVGDCEHDHLAVECKNEAKKKVLELKALGTTMSAGTTMTITT